MEDQFQLQEKQQLQFQFNVGASPANKLLTAQSGTTYDPATGNLVLQVGQHGIGVGRNIILEDNAVTFTCDMDNNYSNHSYPRSTDPAYNTPLNITAVDGAGGTITVNVGATSGTVATAYPRSTDFISNRWVEISNVTTKTFDVQVLDVIPSTNTDAHTFVSGKTNGITFKRDKRPIL